MIKVISIDGGEPVTLAEARAHLEAQPYEDTDVDPIDDTMILGWVIAAREYCEKFLGLSLATKTLELALDVFPSGLIELPGGPVRMVSVTVPPPDLVFETADVESDILADEPIWADGTINPDVYVLDDYREPNAIRPVATWPSVTSAPNAIKIRYVTGYGVDSEGGTALPGDIRAALLLMLAHLYVNREATTDKALIKLPLGVESLLRPSRVRLGMA